VKTSPTTLKGIGILLLALACFSFMDTFTKKVTAQAPILMVIWTRYLIQALVTTAFILPKMGRSVLITEHPWTQVSRGALLMLTTGLAVLSLQFLPVGEFSAIVMTTPLLVTLFASRWLGEHVSNTRIALVAGGFLGTLLIVRPGSSFFGWPMVFPLLLVVANAGFQLLTSKMAQTEKSMTTHFYSVWTGAVLSSVVVYWAWATIEDTQLWLEIIAIAVAGALGHFLLIVAFEKSPAATLMPYMYLQIGLSMLGGWLLFGHVPDHWSVLGIITIAACGLAGAMLTVVEARRKRLL
jgi:drug/metabolite transporter (DMT)-like permease